jgi:hypothetical protein
MAECAMLDFTRRLIAFRQEDGNQRIRGGLMYEVVQLAWSALRRSRASAPATRTRKA